jgi:hypothetical protein
MPPGPSRKALILPQGPGPALGPFPGPTALATDPDGLHAYFGGLIDATGSGNAA